VRITAIQPRLEREGDFVVAIGVQARRAEDLDTFVESLETGAGFHNALAIQSQTDIDGMIEAIVEGVYSPPLDDMGGMSPELLEAAPQGEGA
jgi:hypothetical protein